MTDKSPFIENKNVFELIPVYNRENVLMYLDPPYLLETRKNKNLNLYNR
jgi:DNA adenine methylase